MAPTPSVLKITEASEYGLSFSSFFAAVILGNKAPGTTLKVTEQQSRTVRDCTERHSWKMGEREEGAETEKITCERARGGTLETQWAWRVLETKPTAPPPPPPTPTPLPSPLCILLSLGFVVSAFRSALYCLPFALFCFVFVSYFVCVCLFALYLLHSSACLPDLLSAALRSPTCLVGLGRQWRR